jgi:hypothetical protein
VKAGEELAPIEGKRISRAPLVYRLLEGPDIAADLVGCEGQLVVAAGHDGLGAQRAAQEIERLPERVPGLVGIALGPEEGIQGVTPVETAG